MIDETDGRTDEELMRAYANGNAQAFDRLFDRHRRPLFTYLVHHTGDRDVAEDLFQEIFLRLIRARGRYIASGSFQAWLFTIARNTMTDQRRRSRVRGVVRTESAMIEKEERRSAETHLVDPVAVSELGNLRDRIQQALLQIPLAQREVFLLRERAGLDFRRIARITGCRVATAKSRMRYALANLRRLLAEEFSSHVECSHE